MLSLTRLLLVLIILLPINAVYQSTLMISSMGIEFQSRNNIQLLSTKMETTMTRCSESCNQLSSCRTLDYDSVSKRCRLFEGDSTTGSIIASLSPTSLVGTVRISSTLYSPTHDQSCQACQDSRYEVCSTNTSTCQCPSHTYWDGSVCALQLFENDRCNLSNLCRSDINLICGIECYGGVSTCVPSLGTCSGQTVAGVCNESLTTNQTSLIAQSDVTIDYNNTLYVGDNSNQLYAFDTNSRVGRVLRSFSSWPTFLFFDNQTSSIYMTVMLSHLAYILPTNKTIPPNGMTYSNCSMNWLYYPTGIVVDSLGNVYISSYYCCWVTKWAPNATSGTLVAGLASAEGGGDSQSLYFPYNLALDEVNSFIYVADRFNHRIQRFVLGGSGIAVTVAGGNGPGAAANQLNRPTDIYLSKLSNSIYIADSYNHRIQKWQINGTVGTTVAGSPNGTVGRTPCLMNVAYGLAIDNEEKYVYVSDSHNNRIQRFSLQ